MAGRIRTTKKLAQRIDREYFKKTFPIPHWRRVLSIGLTAVGLIWVGWGGVSGKNQPYNAGPLAHAHKLVTSDCKSCHMEPALWGTKISDEACLKCHDAPIHQAGQTFTPACADCHVEHQSSANLKATPAASCTQCHANLEKKADTSAFAKNIKSFNDGHPEFAAVRPGHAPDPGTIKLNHQVHLKKDLRGPNGPVQLVCADCHQPALAAEHSNVKTVALTMGPKSVSPEIAPVTFDKDCKSCHPLSFDKRFTDPAPHKDAKIVDEYVRAQYTAYIAQHPGEVHERVQLSADLPSRPIPPPPANAAQWIDQRVEEAERLLYQKDCKECHSLTYPAPATKPEVPAANETIHWMKNSWFDHSAHQLVACTECHVDAPKSEKTSDVLLPGIATCQKCHNESSNAAGTGCYECHTYHDWAKAKPVKDAALISQFVK